MGHYKVSQVVPIVALTLKTQSGRILSNCQVKTIFNNTELIGIDVKFVICTEEHTLEYLDNPLKKTSGYTFKYVLNNKRLFNQYPVALSRKVDKWAKYQFITIDEDSTHHYVDLFKYLSALRTSIAEIIYYDNIKIKSRKNKQIDELVRTRTAFYNKLIAEISPLFPLGVCERRVSVNGIRHPTRYKVFQGVKK